MTTDRAPAYPRVLDEQLPAALHVVERYANNPVEADHGRLKARLRPMRGLQRLGSAQIGAWPRADLLALSARYAACVSHQLRRLTPLQKVAGTGKVGSAAGDQVRQRSCLRRRPSRIRRRRLVSAQLAAGTRVHTVRCMAAARWPDWAPCSVLPTRSQATEPGRSGQFRVPE